MPKIMTFSVWKTKEGKYRWVAVSSTAFKDRDGEIVSTKALNDATDYMHATKDYGTLRFWHMRSVDIGKCDGSAVIGRSLIETGTFDNPHDAQKVMQKEWAMSIGYKHPSTQPDKDGVYHDIKIFERSILPVSVASNLFTAFTIKESEQMATQEEKLKGLIDTFGAERAFELYQIAQEKERQANANGVAFKEVSEKQETTKMGKGKKPVMVEEYEEDEDEWEDEEEETPEPPKKSKKKEVSEDALFDDIFVSDLRLKEFGGMLAEIMATVVSEVTTTKEEGLESQVQILTTALKTMTKELKGLRGQVDELIGVQPANGYRASQATDNVTTAKEANPAPQSKEEVDVIAQLFNLVPAQ